jgi:hypothetical protein
MSRRRAQPQRKDDIEWNFFSFPTYFAFFAGMLIGFFFLVITGFAFGVFVLSLFGTSFCTAHAITRYFRNRNVDRRLQRADDDERERRALAARAANALEGEAASPRRRRRRNRDR